MILQDACARRSLIPFLLLQPISRTREQSPPLGDIPSALCEQGQKKRQAERHDGVHVYHNVCIHIHLHQLFPSLPARFVRRRKIYTQNSPESSFGRRRSNLTPFYLTCILQNPLISDTSLFSCERATLFCAPTISLGARGIDLVAGAVGTSPLVPSAAQHECRSRGAKLFLPFASYFAARCANASPPPPPSSDNKPRTSASALPTHTHRHHTAAVSPLVGREFSHTPSAPAARADTDRS